MRFLHTSDLHLGRSLGRFPLADAQRDFLELMVATAIERQVEAVLLAGDIYDRAVPPADSVAMFDAFLGRLRSHDISVIVISGNHDHPLRLGYGANLFREGLHVLTDARRIDQPVILSDQHGEVLVYGIPYLEPDIARRELAPTPDELLTASHEAVVGEAMRRVRADVARRAGDSNSARVVVVSHAFVVGGLESESERDVRVGGVPSVPSAVYEGAHYVALGHLHRRQNPTSVGTDAVLHYSGAPLRYSISDAELEKTVTLVDLNAEGKITLEFVDVPQSRPMADLRGTLGELTGPNFQHHSESWVRLVITDRHRPDDTGRRIREAFPFYVDVKFEPEGALTPRHGVVVTSSADPIDIINEFALSERAEPLSADERSLLDEILKELRQLERAQ